MNKSEQRSTNSSGGIVFAAFSVIAVGCIFLLQSLDLIPSERTWPLYMLIPGLIFLGQAFVAYRDGKSLFAINMGYIGLMIAYMAIAFLIQLPMNAIWPVIIVLTGLAMLLRTRVQS